jgi:hypothetical protein
MEKLLEALKNLLKPEEINDVSKAVKSMMDESEKNIRKEYDSKLHEAYEKFSSELKNNDEVGNQGYQQAWEVISGLQKRIEEQAEEYQNQMDEGFQEAWDELQKEKAKNESIEKELYDEFDKKLTEMKDFMVEKVDQFLAFQEADIYEQAKRDVNNDPRLAEARVALDRIVNIVSESVSDEDISIAAAKKLEEAYKAIEDLRGQMRIVEGRNVKLSMQNQQLSEQARQAVAKVNESVQIERKEKASKKENVSGRGRKIMNPDEIIAEYANPSVKSSHQDQTINEGSDPLNDILVLSGVTQS